MSTGFCFDLDGTVTTKEVLPLLAREIGLAEEIGVLTEATIRGMIDFRASFKLRCRLLAEIPVSRAQAIIMKVPLNPAIVAFIRANRERCAVVTGNLACWVGALVEERLGCELVASSAEVKDDRLGALTHILDKGEGVKALKARRGWSRIMCIGEGMNDVPMLERADIAVAYGGVHPPCESAVEAAKYLVYDGDALCRLMSRL